MCVPVIVVGRQRGQSHDTPMHPGMSDVERRLRQHCKKKNKMHGKREGNVTILKDSFPLIAPFVQQ